MSARRMIFQSVGCVLAVALVSGCAMMDSMAGGSSGSAKETRYTNLEERIQTLTSRIADLEQRNANLQNDVKDLQTRLAQVQTSSGGAASASDVQQLRAQVAALEAQREKDKQVILDQVAKEIAGVAGAAGSKRASPTTRDTSKGSSDVGYEHVVEKGQTLTDIAKAYGVTVAAIKKENGLKSDNISIGQKLFIPKK